jgi:hypothetical protein
MKSWDIVTRCVTLSLPGRGALGGSPSAEAETPEPLRVARGSLDIRRATLAVGGSGDGAPPTLA